MDTKSIGFFYFFFHLFAVQAVFRHNGKYITSFFFILLSNVFFILTLKVIILIYYFLNKFFVIPKVRQICQSFCNRMINFKMKFLPNNLIIRKNLILNKHKVKMVRIYVRNIDLLHYWKHVNICSSIVISKITAIETTRAKKILFVDEINILKQIWFYNKFILEILQFSYKKSTKKIKIIYKKFGRDYYQNNARFILIFCYFN